MASASPRFARKDGSGHADAVGLAVSLTRTLDAPRALVFRCWTRPEHLLRWWGPRNTTTPVFTADLRRGGSWRSCIRSSDGREHWSHGTYRDIVEDKRLVFTFVWEDQSHPSGETMVTVTLSQDGDGTEVSLRQSPLTSAAERSSHREVWGECLDRLRAHLNSLA